VASMRKNQQRLSAKEWEALIDALQAIRRPGAKEPRHRDFVKVHERAFGPAGHDWGVHTMTHPGGAMVGHNFLAWHRQYLVAFERRLQKVNEDVTLPYWDWLADPRIPTPLNRKALLNRWNLSRQWDKTLLPDADDLRPVKKRDKFTPFQRRLEAVHGYVHNAVGGTMASASSPDDPLFWLHHSNVDRMWAEWQRRHKGSRPGNTSEELKPGPIFGNKVSTVLDISKLGYRYG
jgi:tyrosinase